VEVYDRPAVTLEIFRWHARTKEAQLQVELARLKYLAPRERVSGAKERKGGGRGARGVGESFHEIEHREVRDRISELQRELKAIHRESKSSAVVRSPSSATPTPESLHSCGRLPRAKCSWPTSSLRPWISPCERCSRRLNLGFSFLTWLVSSEIFPTIDNSDKENQKESQQLP
jgi:hypothetical protein